MFALCSVSSSAFASAPAPSCASEHKKSLFRRVLSAGKKVFWSALTLGAWASIRKIVVFVVRVVARICLALLWCAAEIAFHAVKSIVGCLMDIITIICDEVKKSISD